MNGHFQPASMTIGPVKIYLNVIFLQKVILVRNRMQTVLLDPCSYNFLILDKINNSDVLHDQICIQYTEVISLCNILIANI